MLLFNSIWLFAVGAVIVPLAIHLWNIKTGKTLKVGSIALLTAASKQSSRSFKLSDVLLLIIRCLLLITLALILSAPAWQRRIHKTPVKGWVMMPKQIARATYSKFQGTVDSLIKVGYEFHYFNENFKYIDTNTFKSDIKNININVVNANYWQLLQQLAFVAPNAMPVYLFTDNGSSHFAGTRPTVHLHLNWQTYTPKDSIVTWIDKAWLTTDDKIKLKTGHSHSAGSYYTLSTVNPGIKNTGLSITNTSNGTFVTMDQSPQSKCEVDTSILKIALVCGHSVLDVNYLNQALKAIVPFVEKRVSINMVTDYTQLKGNYSWIFWLSDSAMPEAVYSKAPYVFDYQNGKVNAINSSINTASVFLPNTTQNAPSVYKTVDYNNASPVNLVWHNGFNNPVISEQAKGKTTIYKFYSRFNPGWSDLVWDSSFPRLILKLMTGNPQQPNKVEHNIQVIDNHQLQPVKTAGRNISATSPTETIGLVHYLWMLLALLFIIERLLATQTKQFTNG
jgi:hypothetical protein